MRSLNVSVSLSVCLSLQVKSVLPASLHVLEPAAWQPKCSLFATGLEAEADGGEGVGATGMLAVSGELKTRLEKRQSPDDLQQWLEGVHEGVLEEQQVSVCPHVFDWLKLKLR